VKTKFDTSGAAVVNNLDSTDRSKRQALRNLNDGLSLLGVAEGGLDEIGEIVSRMRELAVQSASETLADNERQFLQHEYADRMSEITRIADTTKWGEHFLLSFRKVDVGLVVDTSKSMGGEITAVKNSLTAFKSTLNAAGLDVGLALIGSSDDSDPTDGTVRLANINDGNFITELNSITPIAASVDPYAALMNASGVQDDPGTVEPDAISWSPNATSKILVNITDTDRETDLLAGSETQASVATALANADIEVHSINRVADNTTYSTITSTTGGEVHDIGDSTGSGIASAMNKIATHISTLAGTSTLEVQASHGGDEHARIQLDLPVHATADGLGLSLTSVATREDAQSALSALEAATDTVNGYRSTVGALTNRLESAIHFESSALQQTHAAQSRIEDLDMAFATANLAKNQLMTQAGTAVLKQTEQMSQLALQLID